MAEKKKAETKKKAEAKAEAKAEPIEVQPDQFANTNDWPLYRSLALFRVKEREDGSNLVVSEDGGSRVLSTSELLADFEPVKGLHKRAF